MRLVFILDGLTCRECADKIEGHIQRMDGVMAAALMFETGKLVVECSEAVVDAVAAEVVSSAAKAQGSVTVRRTR